MQQESASIEHQHYCLAIIPDEPVFSHIKNLNVFLVEQLGDAETSDAFFPYIELTPAFGWNRSSEYMLVDAVKKYIQQCTSFDVELKSVDALENSILAMQVCETEALPECKRRLRNHLYASLNIKTLTEPGEQLPVIKFAVKPSITGRAIAAEYFNRHLYHAAFNAHCISILRQDECEWKAVYHFETE